MWFSLFTPQIGAEGPEILTAEQRVAVAQELFRLRPLYPILDMPEGLIKEILSPPTSPADCIFALTTATISADLRTKITPCQFGGEPDCSQCGCIASMGLAAVGHFRLVGPLTAGDVFRTSEKIGRSIRSVKNTFSKVPEPEAETFRILSN